MKGNGAVVLLAVVLMAVTPAMGEVIDGVNWADEVVDYTINIQNYGGVLMDEAAEWWLTGPPDADVNGNGYAWDSGDQDTVAGWRSTYPYEYAIVYWEAGLPNRAGDDLNIHFYGGPYAEAEVSASVDGIAYEIIGTIGAGTPGYMREEAFDFDGLFEGCVHYVKVLRTASGPQTGMFFDAFEGGMPRGDLDGDADVGLEDVSHFIDALLGNPPAHPGIEPGEGDMNCDGEVNGDDIQQFIHAVLDFA